MRTWFRVRRVVNYLNLSTPLGLLVAVGGRSRVRRGEYGLLYAHEFRIPLLAGALTIGNVIVTREADGYLDGCLLEHESRHATQYVWCLGLPMLPLYVVASCVSLVLCGNPGSWNIFERRAVLEDGGYMRMGPWWGKRRTHPH